MDGITIASIGILIMVILMFFGTNIGVAMIAIGFLGYGLVTSSFDAALGLLKTVPYSQAITYSFTVIPLFLLMGNAAFAAGLSQGLFDAGNKWFSWMPGGLACATIAACAGFGAICGSSTATCATMGTIAIPEMRKHGYAPSLATGTVSAGGTLGVLIPPSSSMILYGIAAGESIGKLFAAGVFPGILCAALMMVVVVVSIKLDPKLGPGGVHYSWRERFASLKGMIYVIILFLIVIGGMFGGIFTVNEAAAVGAFCALLLMVVRGKMNWANLYSVMKATVKSSAMVLFLVISATVFGNFLAVSGLPTQLAVFVEGLSVSRYLILAGIFLVYAFLGCIMDSVPMMLMTVPIFYPVVMGLGFDGIWFGAIMVLVMNLGTITPPVGLSCYVIAGISKETPLQEIFKGAIPFCIAILASIVIITAFPEIATWLPSIMKQ